MGENLAYVRSSTIGQNNEYQIDALQKYIKTVYDPKSDENDYWFVEKVSGKSKERPELKNCLKFARKGDTIYIHDFSRLARNVVDLLSIVQDLDKRGITLVSLKENIDTSTATGKLMLTLIGAIAEFERANLLEKQKEGIAIAKAKGIYKGRQPARVEKKLWEENYNDYISRKQNKNRFAKNVGITFPTLQKFIKCYENKTLCVTTIKKVEYYYVNSGEL